MKEDWAKTFRDLMTARGFTMKALSLKAGLNESFVRDMLNRNRQPSLENFSRLCVLLGVPVSEFMDTDQPSAAAMRSGSIPLMGYVGAGAEVEPDFEQVPPEGLSQVDLPFPLPDDMIAFKVKGVSMMPVYKPDHIIVVFRDQKKPLESFYGLDAAVRTSDGRRFIKTIERGERGVYLRSWNDLAPIGPVQLDWIGEIFAILPPAALRKVERQGGIQGQLRLKAS